jgi:hypothetical protein
MIEESYWVRSADRISLYLAKLAWVLPVVSRSVKPYYEISSKFTDYTPYK